MTKKILVVAKDRKLLDLIKGEFSDECEVLDIQETGVALKVATLVEKPDIIFTDIFMFDEDGIALSLRLRQWLETPVYLLTTYGAGEGNVRGLQPFTKDGLGKPFSVKQLKEDFYRRLNPKEAPV